VQSALIVSGLITTIAVPLMARRGSQPASKAILRRNYAGNLIIILCVVGAVSLVLYAVHVARDAAQVRRSSAPGELE
jgi:hypothetical protein